MKTESYISKIKRLLRHKWFGFLCLGVLLLLLMVTFPNFLMDDWSLFFLYLLTTVPMNLKFNKGLAISSFIVSLFYLIGTPLMPMLILLFGSVMPLPIVEACISIILAGLSIFTVLLFRKIYCRLSDISRGMALFVLLGALIMWCFIMVSFGFILLWLYYCILNFPILDGLFLLLILWITLRKTYPRLFLLFAGSLLFLTLFITYIVPVMEGYFDKIPVKVVLPKLPGS